MDELPFTVKDGKTVLKPDENGVYTIQADMDDNVYHHIHIEDACGNKTSYMWNKVRWNTLDWSGDPGNLKLSHGAVLADELPETVMVHTAVGKMKDIPVPVIWEIPEGYNPASKQEQNFTVTGTLDLSGTDIVVHPNKKYWQTVKVNVTVAGAPQYTVTAEDCENGSVTVVNAAETAEDGTPVFFEGDWVMLSAVPNEGYLLKSLTVVKDGGESVACKGEDNTYSFIQPGANVTVNAVFEKIQAEKPTIRVTGEYIYDGTEQTVIVEGYNSRTMEIKGHTGTDAGDYTVEVTSKTGQWTDGSTDAVTAVWSIRKADQDAPTGLTGIAPTAADGSDGRITGVDVTMEYRTAVDRSYTACIGAEIANLPAGTYFVRYAADDNHFAGADAMVAVGKVTPLEDCKITFLSNGGEGSMDPVTVKEGISYRLPACGFTAPANQEFKAWEIGGTEYAVGTLYTVSKDTEIKALWKSSVVTPAKYTVTVTNDGNGIGIAALSTAEANTEVTLSATPNTGYRFEEWQVVSPTGLVIANNKFIMPDGNVEVKAIFEADTPISSEFTITFDGNGGTPSAGSMTTTGQKLAILPDASHSGRYRFDGWYTEKSGGSKITTDTVFSANTTVYAHWTYTSGGGSGYTTYTIKATAGVNGSISPSGDVSVRGGKDQAFTITPDNGYGIADVKIDGVSIGAVKSYTFENVRKAHTIEVSFAKQSAFADVPAGSYYEDAVDWAAGNGITQGADATHFSPDGICTRAQAVAFLWRTAGSPAPQSTAMPFTDVPVGSYYYDAVLWAVENGIVKGTSETTFSPNMTCSRAQIVAFLWRSEKSPAAGTVNPFADVKSTAYYADAVLWAVKEDIAKGTTSTTFSPDADCTRAQIVTFLWRCKK